jgi:hypothetical protein
MYHPLLLHKQSVDNTTFGIKSVLYDRIEPAVSLLEMTKYCIGDYIGELNQPGCPGIKK